MSSGSGISSGWPVRLIEAGWKHEGWWNSWFFKKKHGAWLKWADFSDICFEMFLCQFSDCIFFSQILLEKISIRNFESEGLGTACWSWSTFAGATLQVDCGGTRLKSGGVSVFDWKILREQQDKEEFRWNDEFIIFYYLFVAYHRLWHIFWTGRQEFLRGLRCAGGRTLLESHGQSLEWPKGKVLRNVTFFSWGFGSMIDFTCIYGFHPSFWGDHSTRMISKSIATHSV